MLPEYLWRRRRMSEIQFLCLSTSVRGRMKTSGLSSAFVLSNKRTKRKSIQLLTTQLELPPVGCKWIFNIHLVAKSMWTAGSSQCGAITASTVLGGFPPDRRANRKLIRYEIYMYTYLHTYIVGETMETSGVDKDKRVHTLVATACISVTSCYWTGTGNKRNTVLLCLCWRTRPLKVSPSSCPSSKGPTLTGLSLQRIRCNIIVMIRDLN